LIFEELARCNPICVAVFFVIEISQAFTGFQAVNAKAVVGAGGYAFVSFDVYA